MELLPLILLVEDESSLADTLSLNLKLSKYRVLLARSGQEALQLYRENSDALNLALLDVMLPDISGHELCKVIKKTTPDLPVIFLTARAQLNERVEGLKLGADDYISKPFDLEELLLRIANLLKRTPRKTEHIFRFEGGEINFTTYEIKDRNDKRLTLSKREIALLELLSGNINKVISRDEIIEKLWNENENASSRTIDNFILNFRKYFELNPREPRHFQSIRGVGYKFTN
ncbi:MAG: DNA-binding response regulator [Sphingobacteriia bacterium]|jgi:two-component system alkaline phosphatase synthesis response regulator PhoP|nr:DNA-binding response regulator [Sphingobacteriia bacterium]